MPYCSRCGTEVRESDVFCPSCGSKLSRSTDYVIELSKINERVRNNAELLHWFWQKIVPYGKPTGYALLLSIVVVLLTLAFNYGLVLAALGNLQNHTPYLGPRPFLRPVVESALFEGLHIPYSLRGVAQVDDNVNYVGVQGSAVVPLTVLTIAPALLLFLTGRHFGRLTRPAHIKEYWRNAVIYGVGFAVVMWLAASVSTHKLSELASTVFNATRLGNMFGAESSVELARLTDAITYGPNVYATLFISLMWGVFVGGAGLISWRIPQEESETTNYGGSICDWLYILKTSGIALLASCLFALLAVNGVLRITDYPEGLLTKDTIVNHPESLLTADNTKAFVALVAFSPSLAIDAIGLCHLTTLSGNYTITVNDATYDSKTYNGKRWSVNLFSGIRVRSSSASYSTRDLPSWLRLAVLIPLIAAFIGGSFLAKNALSHHRHLHIPTVALKYTITYLIWLLLASIITAGHVAFSVARNERALDGEFDSIVFMFSTGLELLPFIVIGAIVSYFGSFLGIGRQVRWNCSSMFNGIVSESASPFVSSCIGSIAWSIVAIVVLSILKSAVLPLQVSSQVIIQNYQLTVGRGIAVVCGFIIVLLIANIGFLLEQVLASSGIMTAKAAYRQRIIFLMLACFAGVYLLAPIIPILFQAMDWLYYTIFAALTLFLLILLWSTREKEIPSTLDHGSNNAFVGFSDGIAVTKPRCSACDQELEPGSAYCTRCGERSGSTEEADL